VESAISASPVVLRFSFGKSGNSTFVGHCAELDLLTDICGRHAVFGIGSDVTGHLKRIEDHDSFADVPGIVMVSSNEPRKIPGQTR